jgi:polar amino acid transport system permease protein
MIDQAIDAIPFLLDGLWITLLVSALVVVFSLIFGLALGVALTYGPWYATWPIRVFSDVIRGIPILVLIFFVYYGLPILLQMGFAYVGIPTAYANLDSFWAAIVALTMFSTAQVIEIARGALQSIHHGQMEAGKAIGLTFRQRLFSVVFPQALRRFLPPWINAVTDAVKGSALVSLVGVVDLMQSIQQVIGRTYEALPIYILGAIIYFIINYTLSSLSRALEARYAYIRE